MAFVPFEKASPKGKGKDKCKPGEKPGKKGEKDKKFPFPPKNKGK